MAIAEDTQIGSDGVRYPTGTQPTANPLGPLPAFGDVSGASNAETLVFDAASGLWIPGTASGGSADLEGLTDTTITAAAKGDVLVHNGSAWVDVTVGANDTVYTADSAEASGTKWAASSGGANYTNFADMLVELRALGSLVHDYDFGVASGNVDDIVGVQDLVVAAGAGSFAYQETGPTGASDALRINAGAKTETAAVGNWPVGDADRTIIVIARSVVPDGATRNLFGYANTSVDDRSFVFQSRSGNGIPTFSHFFGRGSSANFAIASESPANGEWNVLALTHESSSALTSIHCNETFGSKPRTLNTETTTEGPSVPYDALGVDMWYSHCLVFDAMIGYDYINRLALALKQIKYGS